MIFHYAFADLQNEKKTVQVKVQEGTTVGELLTEMAEKYGAAFKKDIFDPDKGAINDMVMIICNGNLLHTLDGVHTVLQQGDTVLFVPYVMGG